MKANAIQKQVTERLMDVAKMYKVYNIVKSILETRAKFRGVEDTCDFCEKGMQYYDTIEDQRKLTPVEKGRNMAYYEYLMVNELGFSKEDIVPLY